MQHVGPAHVVAARIVATAQHVPLETLRVVISSHSRADAHVSRSLAICSPLRGRDGATIRFVGDNVGIPGRARESPRDFVVAEPRRAA